MLISYVRLDHTLYSINYGMYHVLIYCYIISIGTIRIRGCQSGPRALAGLTFAVKTMESCGRMGL